MAVLPIMLAFCAANLVFILKYTGLLAFGVCFLFPLVLQLRSIYICNKMFGQYQDPQTDSGSTENDFQPLIQKAIVQKNSNWTCHFWEYMAPYSKLML